MLKWLVISNFYYRVQKYMVTSYILGNILRLYLPQIIPFEVEKIVGRKFQIHRFNERKCQNWYVHINNTSCTWFVSRYQFRGVIFTKSQVLAIKLIRFVNAIKFCVAFWAVREKKSQWKKEAILLFFLKCIS